MVSTLILPNGQQFIRNMSVCYWNNGLSTCQFELTTETGIDLDFFAGFLNVELPTYLPFSHGLSFECVVDTQKHKVIPSAVKPKPVEKVSLKDQFLAAFVSRELLFFYRRNYQEKSIFSHIPVSQRAASTEAVHTGAENTDRRAVKKSENTTITPLVCNVQGPD